MNPPDPPFFLCRFFIPKATQTALSLLQREQPTQQARIQAKQSSKHTRVYRFSITRGLLLPLTRFHHSKSLSPTLSVPVPVQLSPLLHRPSFLPFKPPPFFHSTTDQHHVSPALRLHPAVGRLQQQHRLLHLQLWAPPQAKDHHPTPKHRRHSSNHLSYPSQSSRESYAPFRQ